ncbi:MAG: efflux RND transporter periplasmic adaptor subunit [Planctomycetes bacterium]|nr:efflux RND transporter periplasmic adaptor subunit [Planctomycetota bacterium]
MRTHGPVALLALTLFAAFVSSARAHEGHKAEATRGVIRIGNDLFVADEVRKAAGLSFGDVTLGPIDRTVQVRAHVAVPPERQGFASSRIGGRLKAILVRPGDRVDAGQVLGEVESLELETMQRELLHAKIALSLEEANLARVRELRSSQNVTEREAITAEVAEKEARTIYEGARRRLLALGIDERALGQVEETQSTVPSLAVVAPLAGRVAHVDADLGQIVEATDHLFHIVDLSRVTIVGSLPEDQSGPIRMGQDGSVTFPSLPGRMIPITLQRVSPVMEKGSRALLLFADVDNPDEAMRSDASGLLTVVLDRQTDATVAPRAAVIQRGAETFAFVEEPLSETDRENLQSKLDDRDAPLPAWAQELAKRLIANPTARKVSRRLLVLDTRTPTEVEVAEGLYPGDRIVLQGAHELATFFVQGVLEVPAEARKAIGLETEPVTIRTLDVVIDAVAEVELPPGHRSLLSPRLPGKVASVRVRVGDEVAAGDTLAEVESFEAESLSLDLITASLRLELLRKSAARIAKLASAGIPAGRETLQSQSAVRDQEVAVDSIRRQLLAIGLSKEAVDASVSEPKALRTIPIRALISGKVSDVQAEIGRVVTPQDRLIEVVDSSKVWVSAAIPERFLDRIHEGASARVQLVSRPDAVLEGRVAFVGREIHPTEKTLPAWIELENPDLSIRPGMRGKIAVTVGVSAGELIAVPRKALLSEAGQPFLIVEGEKGFERVETEVGRANDRYVEVLKGVYPGDRVVVHGAEELRTALASVR